MAEDEGIFALRIPRSMDGLRQLGAWVDEVAGMLCLSRAAEYALRLCVEEAASNVVMHGRAEGADFVSLRVVPAAEALTVTIEDRCALFDPLQVATPEMPRELVTARVGGVGIHLMRQYARTMRYDRAGGSNRLTLIIDVKNESPPLEGAG